ncbi:hypothetical protein ACQUFY_20880 [Robbsia andropogonis]|uniref:hypothetical protein n=1 Tax=Robbsia andropogonis TaxID=28092 RepID=UPI003D19B53E
MKFFSWLESIFRKKTMSDATTGAAASDSTVSAAAPAATATPAATTVDAATAAATASSDAVLAKVKALLVASGHDVEIVFDDLVAVAKKLV